MNILNPIQASTRNCKCENPPQGSKRVVLTGGPGAGKTAVLEIVRRDFCEFVSVLPEAASIIFGGGFLRHDSLVAKKAAQRAIFHVQRELERLVEEEGKSVLTLCDRGTIDGLAYWPGNEEEFWLELGSTREQELARYAAVIHLRTPTLDQGYNHHNPVRIESALQAAEIDKKIVKAWEGHPRRVFIQSHEEFLVKASQAIAHIKEEMPECCQSHSSENLIFSK